MAPAAERLQAAGRAALSQADLAHRQLGRLMDGLGLGAEASPSTVTLRRPLFELRDFGGAGERELLIVPAPIKSSAIWDLAPGCSVVRRCRDAGLRVSMMVWRAPTPELAGQGLADYVNAIAEAVAALPDPRPLLAGHSLGGTLAAVFASLAPASVRGLLLVAAPLRFQAGAGALESLVAALPSAELLAGARASVPGVALGLGGYLAAPEAFGAERWLDWWRSLPDRDALTRHLRVVRWALDELPMPRRLFTDVIEQLYRHNRFATGELSVNGRAADLERLNVPTLVLAEAESRVVPPASAYPPALAARQVPVLWYAHEPGVGLQHVGPLVGRRAHAELWPIVTEWLLQGTQRPAPHSST